MTATLDRATSPVRIGGRYEVERELGRGGLGAVFRARELSTGRIVALKMLLEATPQTVQLFEHEYQVLCSIQHPGIVRVHDFGVTERGERYYTMEVLPGQDLSALSPLPWKQACQYVRDVAAALAVLHARRLIHRDVSPRNIRIDHEGRATLLDFGALCTFGKRSDVVGTPVCIAPEVMRGAMLDQRTDLYALGVVLYLALTGVRPFAIRQLDEIEAAVQLRPDPPSSTVAEIPAALDQLVLSMLSGDPAGRPVSGAEVVDRISAIAGLADESMADIAEGHLLSTAVCGRDREREQLHRHIDNAVHGQGSVVVIDGAAGIGKTRLAAEALVQGQLLAMACVRVDALGHAGPLGVVGAIANSLSELLPTPAANLLTRRPALQAYLRNGQTARKDVARDPGQVLHESAEIQADLVEWVVELSQQRPLLIVVDDAHTTDPASAGVLGTLAHRAHSNKLLLIVSQLSGVPLISQLEQLTRLGARIKLRGVSTAALGQLVQHVFGEAPNAARLAPWLADITQGNPGQSIQLLSHLIRTGVITYAAGSWILPHTIDGDNVPRTRKHVLDAAVRRLDAIALRSGRALAVHRGPLPLRVCRLCLPSELGEERVLEALESLVGAHLVSAAAQSYYVGDEAVREALLDGLTEPERCDLHLAMARALSHSALRAGTSTRSMSTANLLSLLHAGFHFTRGGQLKKGQALLRDAGIELSHRGEELKDSIPALERALSAYRDQGRSPWQAASLTAPLTLAGLYVDYRLTYRYGVTLLESSAEAAGFTLAKRLTPYVGATAAVYIAFLTAAVRLGIMTRTQRTLGFVHALTILFGVGTSVIGVATALLDVELARRVVSLLSPLRALPKLVPARTVYELQFALVEAIIGNFTKSRVVLLEVLARVQKPSLLLREAARRQIENGLMVVLGGMDCFRNRGMVNTAVSSLAASKVTGSRQAAEGIHAMYHALRGERGEYERHRREVDVLAAQSGDSWRHDILLARNLWLTQALCEDVIGLKQCSRELESIAKNAPSLGASRDAATALYLTFRGQQQLARERYGASLEAASAQVNELTLRFVLALARLERLTGDPAAAAKRCAHALEQLAPEQLDFPVATQPVLLERILSLLDLGQITEAKAHCELLLAADRTHDNPLLRGLTHKTRALLALAEHDAPNFTLHASKMRDWFGRCDNPSLIAQCDALSQLGVVAGLVTDARSMRAPPGAAEVNAVRGLFARCRGSSERVQTALDIIVSHSHAARGYLYLVEAAGDLRFAAPLVGVEPPDELAQELKEKLETLCQQDEETLTKHLDSPDDLTTVVRDEDDVSLMQHGVAGARCHAIYLVLTTRERVIAVGAVALIAGRDPLRYIEAAITREVASALYESADVQTVCRTGKTVR